jgi:primosomal protein N' (replication factor Y)
MLLASATPSLESRKKAEDGAYTLIKLTKRYGNAVLPEVVVADMRGEARTGNLTPIGADLSAALVETFEKGEQSILFLNRRGYNNYVSCAVCGEAIKCPSCSVSMTYHTRRGNYEAGELVCHWCGRRMPLPKECPECKSEHLIRMGYGTQRVEQELSLLLPDAKILRMDTDTTQTKNSYRELLGKFKRHEADILLGTQMVTKGHDFPDVTLVGVLLADASLYYDDYRAEERTFALLTQVIGRAGRRNKPGRAIIQTNNPDHEVIELASMQDYETFYKRTIRLRRALAFPPYCDIALLTLTGKIESDVLKASNVLNESLRALTASEKYRELPFIIFGPFEAPVYRVDSRYRMRMVVKCKLGAATRRLFAQLLSEFPAEGANAPTLSIDFNPTNL